MENVGNTESRNRNEGNATTGSDVTGNANRNGGSFRPDDGNKSSIDGSNQSTGTTGINEFNVVNRSAGRAESVTITDGFYFTPRGTVERIPDGHYIGGDGRLRKRRKQQRRDTSNADGNTYRDRPETGQYEEEFSSENVFRIDKPLNVRGGKRTRKTKTVKEETSKLTMVTMLASGAAAIFTSVALLTKHDHWNLQHEEGKILAEALNDALETLPEKQYAQITGIVEKWIPWINLCFVVGAIIVPRFEASAKRIEKKYPKESTGSDKRDTAATDNPFGGWSSLGYNQ
jgi:hypothetical protein